MKPGNWLACVMALISLLAACNSPAAPAPTAAPSPPPSATLAAPTATLPPPTATLAPPTATQPPPTATAKPTVALPTPAPAKTPFPAGAFAMEDVDGKWVMTFTPDGDYILTRNGGAWVEGRYTLAQNQIVLHDVSGPKLSTCKGKGDGTYIWSFDGKVLTYEVVNDQCDGRRGTQLTRWTKLP
jgi:hypothetical protein